MMLVLKLIGKYLYKNKKRTLCLGLSIMISAAFITSVVLYIDNFKVAKYNQIRKIYGGDYDIDVSTKDVNLLSNIKNLSEIESASFVVRLGEASKITPEYALDIDGYDVNAKEILNFDFIEGRYPKANNEIALESWIVDNLKPVPKVGEKIKLKYTMTEFSKNKNDYKLLEVEDEFIFTGKFKYVYDLISDKSKAKAVVTKDYAIDVLRIKGKYNDNDIAHQIYIKLKPNVNVDSMVARLSNYVGTINGTHIKQMILKGIKTIDGIEVILDLIVLITSTVIIYNMVNTSMIARMSEMGMLKALGLTPAQTKGLIIGEGVFLGVIFIPLGSILGYSIDRLITYIIIGQFNYNILDIPIRAIKLGFIYGFISILIGTVFSYRKIRDVSAIEAISGNNSLDIKNIRFKDVKELGGTSNKFLWDMAKCNIKRNKLKFVMTTISIVITIVVFTLINYIMNAQDPAYGFNNKFNSDFILKDHNSTNEGIARKNIDNIEKISGIKSTENIITRSVFLYVPSDRLTNEGVKYIGESSRRSSGIRNLLQKGINPVNLFINGYDKNKIENLKSNIEEGNLDLDLMDNELTCILVQNLNYNNLTTFKVGDSINVNTGFGKPKSIKISAILKSDGYIKNDGLTDTEIIMSKKAMDKFFGIKGGNKLNINIKNDKDYETVKTQITNIINENPNLELVGCKEELAKLRKSTFVIGGILYTFIAVNGVTSIANIFIIMIMNVSLRKKEFGMLRAIGMSKGEVRKVIAYESIIYGIFGGVIGLVLGVPLTYLFYRLVRRNLMQGMIWELPTLTIIGVGIAIIILCLIAAMIASRDLLKKGVVDSVRAVE